MTDGDDTVWPDESAHDEVYLVGENEIKIEFNIKREKSPTTDLFMIHKIYKISIISTMSSMPFQFKNNKLMDNNYTLMLINTNGITRTCTHIVMLIEYKDCKCLSGSSPFINRKKQTLNHFISLNESWNTIILLGKTLGRFLSLNFGTLNNNSKGWKNNFIAKNRCF